MLGTKVIATTPALVEIEGIVISIHLDESKRKMARVQYKKDDATATANVDFFTINATAGQIKDYKQLQNEIKEISEKGNAEIKELAEKYNNQVCALANKVIGEPHEFS